MSKTIDRRVSRSTFEFRFDLFSKDIPLSFSLSVMALLLFILFRPFYFFQGGQPQLAHYLMLGGFVCVSWSAFHYFLKHKVFHPVVQPLFGFILWCIGVNVFYAIENSSFVFLYPAFYYIFNIAAFFFTFYILLKLNRKAFSYFSKSILLTIMIQVMILLYMIFFEVPDQSRRQNFFLNPNQFGYFSLICATFLVSFREKVEKEFSPRLFWIAFFLCMGMTWLSISRAAILGSVCFFFYFAGNRARYLILLTVAISLFVYFIQDILGYEPLAKFLNIRWDKTRVTIMEWNKLPRDYIYHRLVELRAWDRVFLYPEYLAFGAGEGLYQRFYPTSQCIDRHCYEIHSSLLQILFSYGVVGFTALMIFFKNIAQKSYKRFFILILPLMIYQFFHIGLRDTYFWVLLGAWFYFISAEKSLVKGETHA